MSYSFRKYKNSGDLGDKMAQKQWPKRKSGKGGLFWRRRGVWSGEIGSSTTDALAGGGAWQNSASSAAMHRCVNFNAGSEIGVWGGIFWLGFHWKVDRREPFLLVCSSAINEISGKFRWKMLPAAKYSDGGCGLPRLTTWRNPNPSILKLFYGSDTMLREKEDVDSH